MYKKAIYLGFLLTLAITGCRKASEDTSEVVAKVGTEKITKVQFQNFVNVLVGDEKEANDLLTNDERKGQRNEILARYVETKAMFMLAKEEKLDDDPKVQFVLEQARAQVYARTLLERNLPDAEPTEADLRKTYTEITAMAKEQGAAIPPFNDIKAELPQYWKGLQQREAENKLMEEIKRFRTFVADEYKSANSSF